MASKTKIKGSWYYSVRIWNPSKGFNTTRTRSLKTRSAKEADIRLIKVEQKEHLIKQGENVSFPWENGEGVVKIVNTVLRDGKKQYLDHIKYQGLRERTINRIDLALIHFVNAAGGSKEISSITSDTIEDFKAWSLDVKDHKTSTININLAKIKTFLLWCVDKRYINNMPKIKMYREFDPSVQYFTDSEFQGIMRLNSIENHYKRAFILYREHGFRLNEPFISELNGTVVVVPPNRAKTHTERRVELTTVTLPIYVDIRNRYDKKVAKGYRPRNLWNNYSRVFKNALRELGIGSAGRSFHNLRHTHIVRRCAVSGDIYFVSKEVGHASVTMTEKYANFKPAELIDAFPSIAHLIRPRLETHSDAKFLLDFAVKGQDRQISSSELTLLN